MSKSTASGLFWNTIWSISLVIRVLEWISPKRTFSNASKNILDFSSPLSESVLKFSFQRGGSSRHIISKISCRTEYSILSCPEGTKKQAKKSIFCASEATLFTKIRQNPMNTSRVSSFAFLFSPQINLRRKCTSSLMPSRQKPQRSLKIFSLMNSLSGLAIFFFGFIFTPMSYSIVGPFVNLFPLTPIRGTILSSVIILSSSLYSFITSWRQSFDFSTFTTFDRAVTELSLIIGRGITFVRTPSLFRQSRSKLRTFR